MQTALNSGGVHSQRGSSANGPDGQRSNQRLLLAGVNVLEELVFVRQRAHALRGSDRVAKVLIARSRNAIRLLP